MKTTMDVITAAKVSVDSEADELRLVIDILKKSREKSALYICQCTTQHKRKLKKNSHNIM